MSEDKKTIKERNQKGFSVPDLPPLRKLQWLLEHVQSIGISPYLIEAKKIVSKLLSEEKQNGGKINAVGTQNK